MLTFVHSRSSEALLYIDALFINLTLYKTMRTSYLLPVLAAPFCGLTHVSAQQQPDIIFIMTDQQRADALGCAGDRKSVV